jgi:hypothetical protein
VTGPTTAPSNTISAASASDVSPRTATPTATCDTKAIKSPGCTLYQQALRAVALALADGATAAGSDAPGTLRTVATTVTLVESRAKGESKVGESIILALV